MYESARIAKACFSQWSRAPSLWLYPKIKYSTVILCFLTLWNRLRTVLAQGDSIVHHYMSSKAPYHIHMNNENWESPPGCRLVHINHLSRHGSRHLTKLLPIQIAEDIFMVAGVNGRSGLPRNASLMLLQINWARWRMKGRFICSGFAIFIKKRRLSWAICRKQVTMSCTIKELASPTDTTSFSSIQQRKT